MGILVLCVVLISVRLGLDMSGTLVLEVKVRALFVSRWLIRLVVWSVTIPLL